MPTLVLRALDCDRTHALAPDILRLEIDRPGLSTIKEQQTGRTRHRSTVDRTVSFSEEIRVRLITAGTIKVGSTLTITAARLPHVVEGRPGLHRGKHAFKEAAADYTLWYEVIPDRLTAETFHRRAIPRHLRLRQFFGRLGSGVLTQDEHDAVLGGLPAYSCSEVISVREVMAQQGDPMVPGGSISVRTWIQTHCNIWGEESVIPLADVPEASPVPFLTLMSNPQWRPVRNERTVMLGGIQLKKTQMSSTDWEPTHMARDWIFDVVPSPAFSHLLAYTAKTESVEREGFSPPVVIPKSHNEWESGSFPTEWRPVPGDYVTLFGRHVFDLGHMPMATEIHPPHTIVLERTSGSINRMTIGMGVSGGFPGSVKAELSEELDERWLDEFGGFPFVGHIRFRRCWATNLKRHPLKTKLFPPAKRSRAGSVLFHELVNWRIIRVTTGNLIDFLDSCRGPTALGKVNRSFKEWFPSGFEERPPSAMPTVTVKGNLLDVEIDLSAEQGTPVAYMAELECGWR